MNTPTAQELFRAVKYGQKKNARICEFLSEMLGYTYPALPRTVVKVHQDVSHFFAPELSIFGDIIFALSICLFITLSVAQKLYLDYNL